MSVISREHMSVISREHMSVISREHMSVIIREHMSATSREHTRLLSQENTCLAYQEHSKCIILGTNGVAMARHGLILSQDGATGSRKVSRYLPGLRDAIKTSKNDGNVQTPENRKSKHI